jgi:outer membrane receptor protein involved in Fe transport
MKKSVFVGIVLFSLFCLKQVSYAQNTVKLTGTVKDKISGELIVGALVKIQDTKIAALTDTSGNFELKVAPGTCSLLVHYLGYPDKTLQQINVPAGGKSGLVIELEQADTTKQVIITHQRITNTENAVMNEIKKTNNVATGISGNQIAKSLDRDAAEVVKRVPGVTVIENRFIMVRGLSDRYNTVWLNDAGAPSSEADKKAFSFDVIPSSLIDRIIIYKAASPELPGDFAGGMIKIYTTEFPAERKLNFSISGSYRAGSTFQDFYNTKPGSTDFLGFDDGSRALPGGAFSRVQRLDPGNADIARSFKDNWALNPSSAMPDLRFGFNYLNTYNFNDIKLGVVSSVNYSNTNSIYTVRRTDYDSSYISNDFTDNISTNTARIGLMQNFSVLIGDTKIYFKNLYNLMGITRNVLRTGNLITDDSYRGYEMGYESRGTYSGQLGGSTVTKNEKLYYTFNLGYNYTDKNEPDLRRIVYTKPREEADSMYKAQIPASGVDPNFGGGRIYRHLSENMYSFTHNFLLKLNLAGYKYELNLGNYAEYKSRDFNARLLGVTLVPGPQAQYLERLPVDKIFAPQNFGGSGFQLDEITNPSDAYQGQNLLIASYGGLNLPIGKFRIVAGLRDEYNVQSLQSYVNTNPVTPEAVTNFLLPSVNINYNFTDKHLIRFAYGKTLNRPEFREWSPFKFYDFNLGALINGSLHESVLAPNGTILKVAEIQNFDLRYEYYPGPGETIQFGVFYKQFTNPIEQVILLASSDSRTFSFSNANSAYSAGAELDVRKRIFGNLSVVLNASYIKSEVTVLHSIDQQTTRPMQGQSPYVVNGGLYYQDSAGNYQASLLYNVFGPRIFVVGSNSYPSIGELPFHSLDFSLTKSLGKIMKITLGIQNILDSEVGFVQDTNKDNVFSEKGADTPFQKYRPGRYFTLGLKFNL